MLNEFQLDKIAHLLCALRWLGEAVADGQVEVIKHLPGNLIMELAVTRGEEMYSEVFPPGPERASLHAVILRELYPDEAEVSIHAD